MKEMTNDEKSGHPEERGTTVCFTDSEQLLYEELKKTKAGTATKMMIMLWLAGEDAVEEDQQQTMLKYLLANPESTEGQILHKCRMILGQEI